MSRRFHPEIFNAFSLSSRDPTCLTFSRTFLFILLKLLSVDYFLRSCPLTHLCLKLKIVLQLFYIFEIFLNNKNLDHQKYLTINEFDQKVIDKDIQFRLLNATCH